MLSFTIEEALECCLVENALTDVAQSSGVRDALTGARVEARYSINE